MGDKNLNFCRLGHPLCRSSRAEKGHGARLAGGAVAGLVALDQGGVCAAVISALTLYLLWV